MAMRAGDLRHRVKLQAASSTATAYGGNPNPTSFADVVTRYASIEPMHGNELFQAQQVHAAVTHKITLRYDPEVAVVSPRHRFVMAESTGRVYEVDMVANIDERNATIEVLATERP
jgi:SPP1 family predicted phage head-tail adaptor